MSATRPPHSMLNFVAGCGAPLHNRRTRGSAPTVQTRTRTATNVFARSGHGPLPSPFARRQSRSTVKCAADANGDSSSDDSKWTGSGGGSEHDKVNTEMSERSAEENEAKRERARKELERLEMLAKRASEDSERAQLDAERRRIGLDKARLAKDSFNPEAARASKAKAEQEEKRRAEREEEMRKKEEEKQKAKGGSRSKNVPADAEAGGLLRTMGPFGDLQIPKVSKEDVQVLRENVLSVETFFVTQIETSTFGDRVVFRGNLRVPPEDLLPKLEAGMKKYSLDERVRLFLMEDPAVGEKDKPVVIALPRSAEPSSSGAGSLIFSVVFFLGTALTTLGYGIGMFGLTPEFINEIARGNVDEVWSTIPISLGTLGIVSIHELGHRIAARIRGIKLGLPFFIPSLQIGSYGTITPLNSFPKKRSDFFDVAASGPAAGLAVSLVALLAGLVITSSGEVADWYPQIPTQLLRASILLGSIVKLILPDGVLNQATLPVHPLTVVGYTGMLVNAINLIPIGRLDGGRIVQALYGRITAGRVSGITLLVQGFSAILGSSPLLLFWGLVAVFFQSRADVPCQDEITEPDGRRSAAGLVLLVAMVLILAPLPDEVRQSVNSQMTNGGGGAGGGSGFGGGNQI